MRSFTAPKGRHSWVAMCRPSGAWPCALKQTHSWRGGLRSFVPDGTGQDDRSDSSESTMQLRFTYFLVTVIALEIHAEKYGSEFLPDGLQTIGIEPQGFDYGFAISASPAFAPWKAKTQFFIVRAKWISRPDKKSCYPGSAAILLPGSMAPGKWRPRLNFTGTGFPYCTIMTASPCDSGAGNDSFNLARLGDSSLHHWSGTHR